MEKHISITAELDFSYFSHTTLLSGFSKDITESLVANSKEWNAKTDNINVVGCDGANVNMGHKAGIMWQLEETLQHPLQWLVCRLSAPY